MITALWIAIIGLLVAARILSAREDREFRQYIEARQRDPSTPERTFPLAVVMRVLHQRVAENERLK